ncbi:MAG: hypothetical protein R2737_12910 [Candidatus Nanopelagicales bacterium]
MPAEPARRRAGPEDPDRDDPLAAASLTRRGARGAATCLVCLSSRVTRIRMELADGSDVDFTHCLDCEHRSWTHGDEVLSLEHVLRRSRPAR